MSGPMSSEPGPYSDLIGRRVVAVMDFHDQDAWLVGTLLRTTWDGDCIIATDRGIRYCWPLLSAEIAPVGERRA